MRVAHLILTYTNPRQTARMIKKMEHPDFDFYIHVDKKIDISTHSFLRSFPNVYFISTRSDVKWAAFDTVKATFTCIKEIVQSGIKYDFINFLSGQDYPLKPADQMDAFFRENRGKEFVSYYDYKKDWPEGMIRIEKYFLLNYNFAGKHIVQKIMNFLLPTRRIPYGLHPYGKSMFWMLSPEAAMHVVNTVEKDAKLSRFFSYCWGSDEFVFQTILMNSPFRNKIVNENYRFIDWSNGGASPRILNTGDLERLSKSDMLFARKFNMEKDARILDLIDSNLLSSGVYH